MKFIYCITYTSGPESWLLTITEMQKARNAENKKCRKNRESLYRRSKMNFLNIFDDWLLSTYKYLYKLTLSLSLTEKTELTNSSLTELTNSFITANYS